MNQFGIIKRIDSQLKNTYYEHTILVSNFVLTKVEILTILTITGLSFYPFFEFFRNDIHAEDNLKFIGLFYCIFVLAWLIRRIFYGVKTESVFIAKALGLQTTAVYHSSFKSSKFIPWHSINDVVINEAIVMQKVIFYLAVLVKGDQSTGGELLVPVFTHAQPRLPELKQLYANIQSILRN